MKTFAKIGASAAVSAATLLAGAALAQDVTPAADQAEAEAAVEARQEVLESLGAEMDKLAPIMRGQADFDTAVIGASADEIAVLAAELPVVFAVDTRGFDVETEARDAIWQGHDAFLEKADELAAAAASLQEAAAGGERGPTMRAIGGVGQACGSCHDGYRAD